MSSEKWCSACLVDARVSVICCRHSFVIRWPNQNSAASLYRVQASLYPFTFASYHMIGRVAWRSVPETYIRWLGASDFKTVQWRRCGWPMGILYGWLACGPTKKWLYEIPESLMTILLRQFKLIDVPNFQFGSRRSVNKQLIRIACAGNYMSAHFSLRFFRPVLVW